jgi:hypothetical protein
MQFLAIYLYVTAVGFVTAGVLASFVQLVSGEPMRFGDEPKSLLPSIGGVLLRVLAGPAILMRSCKRGPRSGSVCRRSSPRSGACCRARSCST